MLPYGAVQKKDVSLTVKIDFVKKLLEKWRDAGRLLKHLLLFISLNMQAIRKIVKKQNKRARARLSCSLALLRSVQSWRWQPV